MTPKQAAQLLDESSREISSDCLSAINVLTDEIERLKKELAKRDAVRAEVTLTQTLDEIPSGCPICHGYYIDSSLGCPECGKITIGLSDIHNKCREALLEALRDAAEWQRLAREAHTDLAQAKLQAREAKLQAREGAQDDSGGAAMRTYPGDESKRYHIDGKPCSGPPMSYSYAITDSTRRMACGENQAWCLQCEIWVWPEHIAEGHETTPKKRIEERKRND